MLRAADEARDLCRGLSIESVEGDRRTLLALERLMELIGEAARRVSEAFQRAHPEIAWREIIGLRNVLAHEYGSIDHRRLFLGATADTATYFEPTARSGTRQLRQAGRMNSAIVAK